MLKTVFTPLTLKWGFVSLRPLALALMCLPISTLVWVDQAARADEIANPLSAEGSWSVLAEDFVDDPAALKNGGDIFQIDAPIRAEDAALVPIHFYQTDDAVEIESARLIIDENPAPLAADFTFSEAMHPLDIETRVRVNQYSNVRLIAATDQGEYMDGRFVKASGGCSAPATKDAEGALQDLGKMRLRAFDMEGAGEGGQSKPRRNAQIMIRHPNNSGLQRDQVTQLMVPAFFINRLEVYQGDALLFTMDGGISISENPSFRFAYNDNGATEFRVVATDTDGNSFENRFDKSELE